MKIVAGILDVALVATLGDYIWYTLHPGSPVKSRISGCRSAAEGHRTRDSGLGILDQRSGTSD